VHQPDPFAARAAATVPSVMMTATRRERRFVDPVADSGTVKKLRVMCQDAKLCFAGA
jgi:hypothetical protein